MDEGDVEPRSRKRRQSAGNQPVHPAGSLAPAEHEQTQAGAAPDLRPGAERLVADGIAGQDGAPRGKMTTRRFEGDEDPPGDPCEETVCQSRNGVLLLQYHGNAERAGGESRRPRGVAAGAEQQIGAERGNLAPALDDRPGSERQGRDGAERPLTLETAHAQTVKTHGCALARHDPLLESACRAQVEHPGPRLAAAELARHGEPGEDVPPGPAAGNRQPERPPGLHHPASAFADTPCCEMFNRIPTATRLATSEVPP